MKYKKLTKSNFKDKSNYNLIRNKRNTVEDNFIKFKVKHIVLNWEIIKKESDGKTYALIPKKLQDRTIIEKDDNSSNGEVKFSYLYIILKPRFGKSYEKRLDEYLGHEIEHDKNLFTKSITTTTTTTITTIRDINEMIFDDNSKKENKKILYEYINLLLKKNQNN